MIISHEHRFIFLGIPFSASSAISKELLQQYDCEALLHKHANIPFLLRERPDIDLQDYRIVAVIRDPVDKAFSYFNKVRTNADEAYTDPSKFFENGGYVTKKFRRLYARCQDENFGFEDYMKYLHRFTPYDDFLSENTPYITHPIFFDTLVADFRQIFDALGLPVSRDLPLYNKTVGKVAQPEISERLLNKYFAGFYLYNARFFPNKATMKGNQFEYLRFLFFRKIRSYRNLSRDRKMQHRNLSMID